MLVLDCDPVDDAPILDLRIRKGVRRNGVRLAVASARPGALDPNAEAVLRFAPGAGEALLVGLDAALGGDEGNLGGAATAAGSNAAAVRELADFLAGAGERRRDPLRRAAAEPGRAAREPRRRCSTSPRRSASAGRDGAGLLEIPSATNGRGIREAGFAPRTAPATPTSSAGAASSRRGASPTRPSDRARDAAPTRLPAARRPRCARADRAAGRPRWPPPRP